LQNECNAPLNYRNSYILQILSLDFKFCNSPVYVNNTRRGGVALPQNLVIRDDVSIVPYIDLSQRCPYDGYDRMCRGTRPQVPEKYVVR